MSDTNDLSVSATELADFVKCPALIAQSRPKSVIRQPQKPAQTKPLTRQQARGIQAHKDFEEEVDKYQNKPLDMDNSRYNNVLALTMAAAVIFIIAIAIGTL